jgi:hypothetical protein
VHVPGLTGVTVTVLVPPLGVVDPTVQTEVVVEVTVPGFTPELVVTLTEVGLEAEIFPPAGLHVTDWLPAVSVYVILALPLLKPLFPAWVAVTVQLPACKAVRLSLPSPPLAVHDVPGWLTTPAPPAARPAVPVYWTLVLVGTAVTV